MKLKLCLKPFLYSLTLLLIIAPVGGFLGHQYKFALAILFYGLLTAILINNTKGQNRLLLICALMAPVLLIYTPFYINRFQQSLFSLPSFAAHFLGIAAGVVFNNARSFAIRITIVAIVLFASFWTIMAGYPLWLNKVNYGTFTGRVDVPVKSFAVLNSNDERVTNRNFEGKLVVLDF